MGNSFKNKIIKLLTIVPFFASLFLISSCNNNNDVIKNYKLCEEVNSFIYEASSNGTMEQLENKWFTIDNNDLKIDYSSSGQKGEITYAGVLDCEPFSYVKNGQRVGLVNEFVYKFAQKNNYKINYLECKTHTEAIEAVKNGKADFGGTCTSITEDRMKSVCFSNPFFKNDICIYVKDNLRSKINSLQDLNGKKAGCKIGTNYTESLNAFLPNVKAIEYLNETESFRALEYGKIDFVISDYVVAETVLKHVDFPDISCYTRLDVDDKYGFVFPKFINQSIYAYENKTIACVTGGTSDELVKKVLPNANIAYFESIPDCVVALSMNKVDAYCDETATYNYFKSTSPDLNFADVKYDLSGGDYGLLFDKSEKGLENCEDFSKFIREIKANGVLNNLVYKWTTKPSTSDLEVDYRTLKGDRTFVLCTTAQYPPMTFVKDEICSGLEVDIVTLYCQSRGFKLDVQINSLIGILSGANRYDACCSMITITEERKQNYYFSDPYYTFNSFLVVNVGESKENFFKKMSNEFKQTFITEQRWKLFVGGLLTTFEITVLSIVVGLVVGFGIYLLIRKHKIADTIFRIISYILSGMPVIVLLMIFYYVIFSKSRIQPVLVATIVFTILYACSTIKALKLGVDGVPKSQMEASLALGYKENKALFRFVLPQAFNSFITIEKDEAVSLLKATAVVGYIAIQDLTRAVDIIRSRTLLATISLMSLAIAYFVISFLLIFIFDRIKISVDPARRKKIKVLKGVDLHDRD